MRTDRIGILFVHGIVGNNRIFRFLVPVLPEGAEQLWITLAGHGGNALDFSRASMQQWQRQVEEGVNRLAAECSRIVIVAHSMGCLLALEQALKGRVDGMLLLNPPLRIRPRLRALGNVLKVGLGITGNDEMARAALDAYGVALDHNPIHYFGWPMRYMELFREAHIIRHLLEHSQIKATTGVVTAGGDELVSTKSMQSFAGQANCRVLYLPDSAHYYYPEADKEKIRQLFAEILTRVSVR